MEAATDPRGIFQQQKGSSMPSLIGVARVVRIQPEPEKIHSANFPPKTCELKSWELEIHDEMRCLLNASWPCFRLGDLMLIPFKATVNLQRIDLDMCGQMMA